MRLDVLEKIVTSPIVTKRDIRVVVTALVLLSCVATVGMICTAYITIQINHIYSLLESV